MSRTPPPAPNWPDHSFGSGRDRPGSMLIPGMLVGALLLGFGCLGGLLLGYFAGSANSLFDDLAGFDTSPVQAEIRVAQPQSIFVGQPFDLVVTVAETGGVARTIETIDLNGAVCDSFTILSVAPTPAQTHTEYGWREYTYSSTLLPNDSATFTFRLQPKLDGVHNGTVDAYFDDWRSISFDLSIPVSPAN